MSAPTNDGGYVYPTPMVISPSGDRIHPITDYGPHGGMSLRDWFAGQALAGMMAHKDSSKWTRNEVAGDCYAYADAMIAAREVKP